MARTELDSIVAYTRALLSDVPATTWTSSAPIVDALDAHSVYIDWTPMRHDADYHRYEAKGRRDNAQWDYLAGVRDQAGGVWGGPDFGRYHKVGWLDTQWQISDSADESSAVYSPDVVDAVGATFVFSTAQNRTLYLRGRAYNPFFAAADLLMETPDTGRLIETQRTRGQVSRTVQIKPEFYIQRGRNLNRVRGEWSRA